MKKLLLIFFICYSATCLGQNNGAVSIPANADTSSTGFALKASLRPYLTKAQIIAAFAPISGLTVTATNGVLTIPNATTLSILGTMRLDAAGTATLVSGTKAITITGLTTSSIPTVSLKAVGGTVTTTWQYRAVCTTNTLTITAITNANATNTSDASIINYIVVQ